LNPFYIQKNLDTRAGKVENDSQLRNDGLLVEVNSAKQSEKMLKDNFLESYPVKLERHASRNSSRGVTRTETLDDMSDDEI
jgi:hypothetical protein